MIRVCRPDGVDEGWVRTDLIVRIHPNPGQRIIHWLDEHGAQCVGVVDRAQDGVIMSLVREGP